MKNKNDILRIVAYCRVSTEKDDQINSLESQKKYFSEYIKRNPEWKLINVYADEGVTGTSTKKRHAFNQMIDDATNKKFDFIITKEISRFARNTLDSIFYTRKLKDLGVGVLFVNDNINTLDSDAELRLTIMSSIAQEESRKTSQRVKWGQKRSMEQGVVFGRDMLGYDVKDGKLYINESGAETVRLIYHKFLNENKGTHVIARELKEEGIMTSKYMKQWTNTVVLRILKNEKYCGDLVQKKTYTPNYLNHEKKYNNGEEDFILIKNHHEPIISRDMFDKVQKELKSRSQNIEQRKKYSNRYCFSGKIICGNCGKTYVSRIKKRKDGTINRTWKCYEYVKHGTEHVNKFNNKIGCDNISIKEDDLKPVMLNVVKNLNYDKESLSNKLITVVKVALSSSNNINDKELANNKIQILEDKKRSLIELYLNKNISKNDFIEISSKLDKQLDDIRRENYKNSSLDYNDVNIEDISLSIKNLIYGNQWDDIFYRNILEKIIVNSNGSLKVNFIYQK